MVFHKEIKIKTVSGRTSYHDIQNDLVQIVESVDVRDGILVISTPHTTCSFYYEENMHDRNFYGDDFLQVDINNLMEKLAPKMTSENQYNSPGEEHIKFGLSLTDPNYPAEKWVMLNTDAHLKSSVFGTHSETLIIKDGQLLCGSLGKVYFVDWDQLRERDRTVNVLVMGE